MNAISIIEFLITLELATNLLNGTRIGSVKLYVISPSLLSFALGIHENTALTNNKNSIILIIPESALPIKLNTWSNFFHPLSVLI
jgi:hypothetical protein